MSPGWGNQLGGADVGAGNTDAVREFRGAARTPPRASQLAAAAPYGQSSSPIGASLMMRKRVSTGGAEAGGALRMPTGSFSPKGSSPLTAAYHNDPRLGAQPSSPMGAALLRRKQGGGAASSGGPLSLSGSGPTSMSPLRRVQHPPAFGADGSEQGSLTVSSPMGVALRRKKMLRQRQKLQMLQAGGEGEGGGGEEGGDDGAGQTKSKSGGTSPTFRNLKHFLDDDDDEKEEEE